MHSRWIFTLAGLAAIAPSAFAATDVGSNHTVDAIALYSQGAAVVQDSRTLTLEQGEQTVSWPMIDAIQPDTLWLSGKGVQLTGFDINARGTGVSGSHLSDRIGRSVTLRAPGGETRQGTLVNVDGDTAYVRVDTRIERITAASPVEISWPVGKSRGGAGNSGSGLTMNLDADKSGQQKLTVTYQSKAPSWQASYTGRFHPASGKLRLVSQALIDNSGHEALDARQAWLVAGDTSRAHGGAPRPMMMAKMASSESSAADQPQAVGDVYRYPLAHGLHVKAGAVKSVALMQPISVEATRRYRFENYALSDTGNSRQHAQVSLAFDNSSGRPLPAGAVRIYDAGHAAQLMGGTRIDNTPAGAPVTLALGGAFDITGIHRVTKTTRGDNGVKTTRVRVELFNAGDKARQVTIAERLPAGAKLADDAPRTRGGSAEKPEWRVSVPAGGHRTLRYRFLQPKSS
ncbi:DUF4139 domain-containing protein [Salinisphaera sp. LB1]|uniref:DUF4139 domain-containing protein n=1 Tax=Salinisphaera sp. LB1 TaxID=2183911 RepID=UPI000D7083F4|nr:hypothetical protein [Salinisphaera sp. LB1]AWN16344.1 hypothetical protein SALB1_2146 [Salinisphaera sp. LB1]